MIVPINPELVGQKDREEVRKAFIYFAKKVNEEIFEMAKLLGETLAPNGVPSGGSTNQVLAKVSGTDYDMEWTTGGGVAPVDSVNGYTGIVTLNADDILEGATNKYMSPAEKTTVANTSGVNTGDQNLSGYVQTASVNYTDLTDGGATTLHKHDHDNMDGIDQAATGVTNGHISDGTQSIAGSKSLTSNFYSKAQSEFGAGSTNCARFSNAGILSFRGTARMEVGGNAWAFRYSGLTLAQTFDTYGLAFNATRSEYTWHTSGGAIIAGINVTHGGLLIYGNKSYLGFGTGAGGTVTQATSKATSVSLSRPSGNIITHNASLAAGAAVSFTLNNSRIAATDVLAINCTGGTAGAYVVEANSGTNLAVITITNISAGALAEALTLKFIVLKAVTA